MSCICLPSQEEGGSKSGVRKGVKHSKQVKSAGLQVSSLL